MEEEPKQANEQKSHPSMGEEPFIPQIPKDIPQAAELMKEISVLLKSPEQLPPTDIYSMVLTMNECSVRLNAEEHLEADEHLELVYSLCDNYQTGLQAMLRSKRYNAQEHDGLRHDLHDGYLNQLNILQSHFSNASEDTSTSSHEPKV